MTFDCKSQHHKCKAMCCGMVPLSKERWERNRDRIVTHPEKIVAGDGPYECTDDGPPFIIEGDLVPITESGKCAFLNHDLSCNIYDDRPDICKRFGTETHLLMKCSFQDKDGKPRSRQVNRKILRDQEKYTDRLMKRFELIPRILSQHGQHIHEAYPSPEDIPRRYVDRHPHDLEAVQE